MVTSLQRSEVGRDRPRETWSRVTSLQESEVERDRPSETWSTVTSLQRSEVGRDRPSAAALVESSWEGGRLGVGVGAVMPTMRSDC